MTNETATEAAQYTVSKVHIHKFIDEIIGKKLLFQVVQLEGTLMIYINENNHLVCKDLVLSMKTLYSSMPQSTSLLGAVDESSTNISSRLAKRLHKVVYLSINLDDRLMVPLVEKRLLQEITNFPNKF